MSQSFAAYSKTLTISNGEWPPFQGEKLKNKGIVSDICVNAFAKVGYQVKFEFHPWKRAYLQAKNGSAHASLNWKKTPDRENEFFFSKPILTLNDHFFYNKYSNFDWKKFEDLKNYKVGTFIGYAYIYSNLIENGTIKTESTVDERGGLRKLARRRIDVLSGPKKTIFYYLDQLLAEKKITIEERKSILIHPKAINTEYYHLITPKNSPESKEILSKFNQGMKLLEQSGELKKIYQNHGIDKRI